MSVAVGRLQAALGDLGDASIEIADEEGMHGVPGMPGPHHDVHVPVVGKLPYRLGVVRQERRRAAEEPLVPGRCRRLVADGDARKQIYCHEVMLGASRRSADPQPQLGRCIAPGR
jgi:hypothetical protein